ncbi:MULTISPECIES: glycosyltransferase family 39 protein [Pseudomonas]|uniref:glycosyltransferase family 39 protein n=1 Tax=Pseudomonas TaxID=286 RepID=UPI001596DF66|nr:MULTISPECIES: glycosyltransferase family 39 protein [Pseudomonas]
MRERLFKRDSHAIRTGAVLAILLISFAGRLFQVTVPVLWSDESFSILLSRLPLEQILFHTARDVHPPLYYLILHFWMQGLGDGALAVRSLSVLTGVATVAFGMLLARQLASWRAAFIAGLLLAVLPVAIHYSQEARMYALLGCLLMAAMCMLWSWVHKRQTRYLVAYGALILAALYTHYFAILCVAANWTFLLVGQARKEHTLLRSPGWWLCNGVVALAFMPWLPVLYRQFQHRHLVAWIADYTPISLMTIPRGMWSAITSASDLLYADIYAVVTAGVLISLLRVFIRRALLHEDAKAFLLTYCLLPIITVWLVSYLFPLFMERYVLFALLGIPIVLAITFDTMQTRKLVLAVVACWVLEMSGLVKFYSDQLGPNNPVSGLSTVMHEVNGQWHEGDAVLVDSTWRYLSVFYYNKTGQRALVYTWVAADTAGVERDTYGAMTLFYQQSGSLYVNDPLSLSQRYRRVWWITNLDESATERQMNEAWTKTAEIRSASSRALLYTVPMILSGSP